MRKAVKNNATNPESQWFGYKAVAPEAKTAKVAGVFGSVASKYDLMNDLMSLGIHRLWKRALFRAVNAKPGEAILDVAGGTGDIALGLVKRTNGQAQITVCDLTPAMLEVGRARAIDAGWRNAVEWVQGDAAELPFEDSRFDAYTIAFGLRNVTRIDDALREAARVLKPGGRFFCLEFAPVEAKGLKELYDLYSFTVLPWLGERIANDRASYQYLAESIRQMPSPDALAGRLEAAGFTAVRHTALTGGICVLHEGIRV